MDTNTYKRGVCSITPPKDAAGSHRIRWSEPGKGQQERTAKGKSKAHEIADEITARVQQASLETVEQIRENMKVSTLAQRYLATIPAGGYRDRQEAIIRLWIKPQIGHLDVVEGWSPAKSKHILDTMRAKGLSQAYIQNVGSCMRSMISFAHASYWLGKGEDPMFKVAYQEKAKYQGESVHYVPRNTVPSLEQVQDLCEAGRSIDQERLALMWELKSFCGARWAEIIALRPADFDMRFRRVFINKTVNERRGGRLEFTSSTKNGKARHSVFPKSIEERLGELLDSVSPSDLVFVGANGKPLRRSNHLRFWYPAAEKAGWPMESRRAASGGLKPIWSPHDLRHSAACWMLFDLKAEPPDVAFWLGHHSPAFTMARYVGQRGNIDQTGFDLTEGW